MRLSTRAIQKVKPGLIAGRGRRVPNVPTGMMRQTTGRLGCLDPYHPSPLGLPANMPGFHQRGVRPATAMDLAGFALGDATSATGIDWAAAGTSLISSLTGAIPSVVDAWTAKQQKGVVEAQADKARAEAEATGALALLQQAKSSPVTWGILGVGALVLGGMYILSARKRRRG